MEDVASQFQQQINSRCQAKGNTVEGLDRDQDEVLDEVLDRDQDEVQRSKTHTYH